MDRTPLAFKENAHEALGNRNLQTALHMLEGGLAAGRGAAVAGLPEFESLRDEAVRIKEHVFDHLDWYLERFEENVNAAGGEVHWCSTPEEARTVILDLCDSLRARTVTKGKSMIAEEIDLNRHLEEAGITPVETDLGEYIIQLADEPPSHIIGPAVHKTKDEVSDLFYEHHARYGKTVRLEEKEALVAEAREVMRQKYLDADVGITGANFLIAETGATVIVTNEGNGDLTQTLPGTHIVITSIEKVVPTMEDCFTFLRLLARSATGQEFSAYTTFSAGGRRKGDLDGPEKFHVVLLDNGRSRMLAGRFREMLRCIRCGACMNHCPVYAAVGGHSYGATYVGPMGAVLTPHLVGIEEGRHLPNASTFCGRCEAVCPVKIPLPRLMRYWREAAFENAAAPAVERSLVRLWAFFARHPVLYRWGADMKMRFLARLGRRRGAFRRLPFAGGWTKSRDFPAPQGRTFMAQWKARGGGGAP